MVEYFKKGIGDKSLLKLEQPIYGTWVNVLNPTKEEVEELSDRLKIPKEFLTNSLDENEKPRIEKEDGVILIILRMPIKNIEHDNVTDDIETIPLGIIITHDFFVTVCLRRNDVIDDFRFKLKNFKTSLKTRFLLLLLHRINNYFNGFLDNIESEIDKAEKLLASSIKNSEIIKCFSLKKTLIYFNTAVVGNNNVLKKVLGGKILRLYEEDEDLLEDIIIENNQAIEMVSVYTSILSGTLDAYASIVSNNLNLIMKTLAIITIFFAIPTMVTSFYGMNVILPFQDSPYAYVIVIFMFLLLATILYFAFKFTKWL